ncbi:hypothetical protein GOP47_0030048 [Adiantum capillus-veneris]|nr:hypothetical protein GOP47_0030048 [Adiantum capillus-veneris]
MLCAQVTIEVWDVEDDQLSMATSVELSLPITCCSVLQAPESILGSASTRYQQHPYLLEALDLLLVVDSEGEIIILKWDASISGLAECSQLQIFKAAGIDSSAVINETILSKPLFIFDTKVKGFRLESMQQGISMIAVCSFEEIVQVVCVSWGQIIDANKSSALSSSPTTKNDKHSRNSHDLQLHLLKLATEHVDIFPSFKAPYVLGLSFVGGNTTQHQTSSSNALDHEGRPLLVVLSSNRGLNQNLLSLECWVVDLSINQLRPGPWKISNLHPTTRLLVPWAFRTISELDIGVAQLEGILPPKIGVLAISSTSVTFCQVNGARSSLVISLQGLPICYEICNNNSLVIADSSSMLYIIDVRDCCQLKMQRILCVYPLSVAQVMQCLTFGRSFDQQKTILFVYGEGGDAHIFRLFQGGPYDDKFAYCAPDSETFMFPECLSTNTLHMTFQEENASKKETPQNCGFLSDSIAPVNDSLLICNDDYSSNHQLLLACGNVVNGTLRKATLAYRLIVAEVYDIQMDDLPTVIPIKLPCQNVDSILAVLSYGVRDASQLVEFTETGTSSCFMEGFDSEHHTLAVAYFHDRYLVQVTSNSVRVLRSGGPLVSEWSPPTDTVGTCATTFSNFRLSITAATLHPEGIVLAVKKNLYSIRVDAEGGYHVIGMRLHSYELSSIEICHLQVSTSASKEIDFPLQEGVAIIIAGEWISNMACLLTWPHLKGLAKVECGSVAPIRSVAVADFDGLQCLLLGNSAGVLYLFKLLVACMEVNDSKSEKSVQSPLKIFPEEYENLEILTAAEPEGDSFLIVDDRERVFEVMIINRSSFKVGSSEVSLLVGSFFGTHSLTIQTKKPLICIFAHTSEHAALVLRDEETLSACAVHGGRYSMTSTASFHTERSPFSLIAVCRNGRLLISHLDIMPKLCWDVIHLDGTPSLLAYHKASDCVIASCQGSSSAWLCFIRVQGLQNVLTVELGEHCQPTFLGTIAFPNHQNASRPVDCCLIVGSKVQDALLGSLSFLSYQTFSPGKQQMQYEAHLVAKHGTETSFLCYCVFFESTREKLLENNEHELMSRLPLQTSNADEFPSLAVGGFGKVVLYLLALEQGESSVDKRIVHLERALEFPSPGKSFVTGLASMSDNTLLVVEELYGVSIFHVQEAAVATPLSTHRFDNPVQAACPLSSRELLLAVYGEGITLMLRNKDEELAYQVERLEFEDIIAKRRAQETEQTSSDNNVPRQEETEMTLTRLLPSLESCANLRLPFTATKFLVGKLGISVETRRSVLGENILFGIVETLVVVTQFGEIGSIRLMRR